MTKTRILKISQLILDTEIYPRMKVAWFTAYHYTQAMKSGSTFPPIKVGLFNDKYYVVDGWHRITAMQMLKIVDAQADIKTYSSLSDMFIDAIKFNTQHGRQLSIQKKVRIIYKLDQLHLKPDEISSLILVPADKIERFRSRIIYGPNGQPIFQKRILLDSEDFIEDYAEQKILSAKTTAQILRQLIRLIKINKYPFQNKTVQKLGVGLQNLLSERKMISDLEF